MKTKTLLAIAAMGMPLFFSCNNMKPDDEKAENANKKIVDRICNAYMTGETAVFDSVISPDVVEHTPDPGLKSTGIQAWKDAAKMYHDAYPNSTLTDRVIVADNDLVSMLAKLKGKNTGTMGGMPATNKDIDIYLTDVFRFKDGKVVEHWTVMEDMKMMMQLGMMPGHSGDMPKDSTKAK
jgi:predicted ester cyclase